jgi:hypothetical protein
MVSARDRDDELRKTFWGHVKGQIPSKILYKPIIHYGRRGYSSPPIEHRKAVVPKGAAAFLLPVTKRGFWHPGQVIHFLSLHILRASAS